MTKLNQLNTDLFNSMPESYVGILNDAPSEFPIDAMDCAIGRAVATIALIHVALNADSRVHDFVITDALWGVQSQLDLVQKLANHYNNEAIYAATKAADSTISLLMMSLGQGSQPADRVISSALDCVAMALNEIKNLANLEHEQQRQLRAV